MALIDRAATFRGKVVDHGVSITSKGEWPQFVCSLIGTEIWDEEEKIWVDWTDVDLNEITAYVVLYGSKGETLSFNQVKKIFNWDGASFKALNDGDYSEVGIQFRVVKDTYLDKTRLKVEWIDEYDAEPGRSVRKLNPDEMKQLDAKYAKFLKQGASKKAPVKASGGKAGIVTAKDTKPTSPKGPVKKKESASPPEAKQTATEATAQPMPADPDLPVGKRTKDEAWTEVVDMRDKKTTDSMLAKSWQTAIKEIGGGKPTEQLTDEEWFLVKEKVLSETAVF